MNTTLKRLRPPRSLGPNQVKAEVIARAEHVGWDFWGAGDGPGTALRFFKGGQSLHVRLDQGSHLNLQSWIRSGPDILRDTELEGPAEYVLEQFSSLFCDHSLLQSVRNSAHAGHLGDTIRLVLEVACQAPDQVPDSWVGEAMPYAKGVGLDLDLMTSIMAHHPAVLFDVAGGQIRRRGRHGFTVYCPDVIYDRIWEDLLGLVGLRYSLGGHAPRPRPERIALEQDLWKLLKKTLPPDLERDLCAQFRAAFVRECLPCLLWGRFEG